MVHTLEERYSKLAADEKDAQNIALQLCKEAFDIHKVAACLQRDGFFASATTLAGVEVLRVSNKRSTVQPDPSFNGQLLWATMIAKGPEEITAVKEIVQKDIDRVNSEAKSAGSKIYEINWKEQRIK